MERVGCVDREVRRRVGRMAAALGTALALAACDADEDRVYTASLADGTYRVVGGNGFAPADEARLLAVTARLDRANERLVFTMADGSQQTSLFSPRPRDRWQPDCFTTSSHYSNEVADLSPAPLQIESLTFATPVVFAKCGPRRMILADAPDDESSVWLALDLQ